MYSIKFYYDLFIEFFLFLINSESIERVILKSFLKIIIMICIYKYTYRIFKLFFLNFF